MTLGSTALAWGAGLLAFAPTLCLFFQFAYPKPQLIIVCTTAAFFQLLAALCASVVWYLLDPVIGLSGAWAALVPGVFSQFVLRCSFVAMYHKVERVIEETIANELEREQEQQQQEAVGDHSTLTGGNFTAPTPSDVEAAKLRLALNDGSCAVAAGAGFGGFHAILLYGTLLASEASADAGILYQPSCPYIPALLVSAVHCFMFSILDILWMLMTFFGVRRRLLFPRGGGGINSQIGFGAYFGNTRNGGNMALLWVLASHFAAAFITVFNQLEYGCAFSLSLLPVVVICTACMFWAGVSRIYMPLPNSTARLSLPASFSYGGGSGDLDDEDDEDDLDADLTAPISPARRNAYHED